MPIATVKRSLEYISPISKPYLISGNFQSIASCPRSLTLCKVEGGTFGHKGIIARKKNTASLKELFGNLVTKLYYHFPRLIK